MLTGQSEGGRPITDLAALPEMCGHETLLWNLQQRVCLKNHNRAQLG